MPQIDQMVSGTKEFQAPILARSLAQLATSFGGFFATCAAMYLCLSVSLWITLPMSALAAGFLVRIFIIQHDCGHGSFFRSRWANELVGSLCSVMTLTPYALWRRQHARHHGSWNNLDLRAASGLDIYSSCMTVAEYRALGLWRRCLVRLTNHPIALRPRVSLSSNCIAVLPAAISPGRGRSDLVRGGLSRPGRTSLTCG